MQGLPKLGGLDGKGREENRVMDVTKLGAIERKLRQTTTAEAEGKSKQEIVCFDLKCQA
ncbi:hypothetical protein Tsubulata_003474, partial [Turnera subulata]